MSPSSGDALLFCKKDGTSRKQGYKLENRRDYTQHKVVVRVPPGARRRLYTVRWVSTEGRLSASTLTRALSRIHHNAKGFSLVENT